jgi:hypothetical protein
VYLGTAGELSNGSLFFAQCGSGFRIRPKPTGSGSQYYQ